MSGEFKIHSERLTIPFEVVEPLRPFAREVHGQSLERLHERGGLGRVELGGLLVGVNMFGRPKPLSSCKAHLPFADLYVPAQQSQPNLSQEQQERLIRIANVIGAVHRPGADPDLTEDDAFFLRELAGEGER